MEGFPSRFPGPACGRWDKREGRFLTPQGLNYLDICKAILAQVHPGLPPLPPPPPPLQRRNTKECGVQVNARVDKIVQCSLGPKTLFCDEASSSRSSSSSSSSSPRTPAPFNPDLKEQYGTPVTGHRFLRPVSIYSPVFDRRISPRLLAEEGGRDDDDDDEDQEESDGEEKGEETVKYYKTAVQGPLKGPGFQFLEQRYGFFHCKKCNIRWESAYVWCISGTNKVYYKQLCRKCQVGFNPFRVESILCKGCSQTSCICDKKQRHINMRRPHRQELCCRCKGMRLSCDATYSFKYIV